MNNQEFNDSIKKSYEIYLQTHRRSNAKLKPLHGAVAQDIQDRLGDDYVVKSLGFSDDKEGIIEGRYMKKKADISIFKKENGKLIDLGGIAVKSIMTNYSQNSVNYFEAMLGETANIRSVNKLYFHLVVLPEKLPYFGEKTINNVKMKDIVTGFETISQHNIDKYIMMSNDNINELLHSPNGTLLQLISTTDQDMSVTCYKSRDEWQNFMSQHLKIQNSNQNLSFGNNIIYNNYEKFIDCVVNMFLAINLNSNK